MDQKRQKLLYGEGKTNYFSKYKSIFHYYESSLSFVPSRIVFKDWSIDRVIIIITYWIWLTYKPSEMRNALGKWISTMAFSFRYQLFKFPDTNCKQNGLLKAPRPPTDIENLHDDKVPPTKSIEKNRYQSFFIQWQRICTNCTMVSREIHLRCQWLFVE